MPLLSLLIFSSLQFNTVTLNIMPEFRPNKVMLSKHSARSGEDWKIFAECVREAIANQANLDLENRNSLKEKHAYVSVMSGKEHVIKVDGKELIFDINLGRKSKSD